MKASVQYGDFTGTAAADFGDSNSLEQAATELGVDVSHYKPVGLRFYSGGNGFFSVDIHAIDEQMSTEAKPGLVEVSVDLKMDEFFALFKRFQVVIYRRFSDFEDAPVSESISATGG